MSSPPELTLTHAQISQFDTEGYLILRLHEHNLVDAAELQQWTSEVRSLPLTNGKWMPYDELTSSGTRQIMRTENFADFHAGFGDLLHGSALNALLRQLTRDDMLLFKEKINYKLPGGGGFGAHIDAPAYEHVGKIEHTTANLAVDAATPENGCVEVVRGSHRTSIPLAAGSGGAIDPSWEAEQVWTPVPLSAGDLLIFGSHLAHRSAVNSTSGPRRSIYATYHMRSDGEDLRKRYYEHRREEFPPDHERVPGKDYEAGVKRYAFAAPFTEIKSESGGERRQVVV